MTSSEDILISKIRERIQNPRKAVDLLPSYPPNFLPEIDPPISLAVLEKAERRLGFQLPPLLRRLYLEVSNGGFGPAYGLSKIYDELNNEYDDLVGNYLEGISEIPPLPYQPWPKNYIIISDWGCLNYSLLNWTDSIGPISRLTEYAGGPWENFICLEAPSLQAWLEDWLEHPLSERWKRYRVRLL